MHSIRVYFSGLLLTGLASLMISCGGGEARQQDAPPKTFNVKALEPTEVVLYQEYPASIEGQDVVEIRPKVDGYVEEIYIDEGATVKKGQLLFKIFNPQYEQDLRTARAGVETAQAEVKAAELTVEKQKPLVEKDIISSFDLKTSEYTLQSKKALLMQAKATLANAQTNLGYTTIKSPVNGVTGMLPHKKGSLVSSTSTEPLTTISSSGNMYVYFALNEKQLLEISREYEGSTIQEKLKKFPDAILLLADGTEYDQKGKVLTASGLITTATGSTNLRATFPNPMGILRSGGSGTIRIPRALDNAIVIPQSATYDLQDKHFVYVLQKDNTVKSTSITVQSTPDGKSFVVSEGLKKGDKIVVGGTNQLSDGAKITPAS